MGGIFILNPTRIEHSGRGTGPKAKLTERTDGHYLQLVYFLQEYPVLFTAID